jgi:ribonucleoside-diphosphate reductase alpha chain
MNLCLKIVNLDNILCYFSLQGINDYNMLSHVIGKQLHFWATYANVDISSSCQNMISNFIKRFSQNNIEANILRNNIDINMNPFKKCYIRDQLFDPNGLLKLRNSYMLSFESSPQDRFEYIAIQFSSSKSHAAYLYDISSKHWISYSTPILAYGKTKHGLPISCYLSYLSDTSDGLLNTLVEVNELSMLGGGVGIGVGLRSPDHISTGCMSHLKTYDSCSLAYRQDRIRRGAYAAYLNIDHPEVIEFIDMRKSTGDHNIRCLNIHHGICITDKFMNQLQSCNSTTKDTIWKLVDPHTKECKKEIDIRHLWQRILETRLRTGEPYICFIDTCNNNMNPEQKEAGLGITQSNLCTEIILPTNENRTAICCLTSLNLEYYDEWKNDNNFFLVILEMLDNVLEFFILKIKNKPRLHRLLNSVINERSIGLGVLGFHAYLQKHNIAFESEEARKHNIEIFSFIRTHVDKANKILGKQRGSPSDCLKSGNRFAYTIAIAPNASTSIIIGNTSPGIEPFRANAYRQDTSSGSYLNKNKFLKTILHTKKSNKDLLWNSIITNNGSVQHLTELTNNEKDIYKTAFEIDQNWIIKHAADRQPFIDQAQSVNLFIKPTIDVLELHNLHFSAWKLGLKTLYYCRSTKLDADRPHINECSVCQ